ncbi:MAG: hypothetical protein AAF736_13075, partial [Pseudomonadota bacterium]
MTTVPGPFYTLKQRVPALCALLLVALLVLAGTSAGGWPAPGLSVPALASLVLILPVAVALEILLGPLLLGACVACCVGLALGIPQLLDGSQQLGADTPPSGACQRPAADCRPAAAEYPAPNRHNRQHRPRAAAGPA